MYLFTLNEQADSEYLMKTVEKESTTDLVSLCVFRFVEIFEFDLQNKHNNF